MKRLLFFILRLAIVVAAVVWFVNRSGSAHLIWGGHVIDTSTAFIGFCALAVGFTFYLLFRLMRFLRHGSKHVRMRKGLKKWQHGHDHLTQGLIAIAGGDAAEAGRRAVQARKFLGATAATRLLQAQAAQLAGDTGTAQEIFRTLAAEPDSAVLGYRGLIMEARRARNWTEAERLVEKLHRLKPETPWLNLIRFDLLARRQAWDEANIALAQAASSRLLEPVRVKNYRAAILAATAQNEVRQGRYDKALQAAEQAVKQAPGWLPAIISLAQAQMLSGHRRAMLRTVEKNWQRLPHPQLAALVQSSVSDPVDACKQVEKLCAANEDSPVSHLAITEAALAADIWGTARRHLMALINRGDVTQMVYRLMARLERRESGNEHAALQWMTKAVDAPADPAWLCNTCGGTHKEWQALCSHCGSFNTLDWQSPGVSRNQGQGLSIGYREPEIIGQFISS